MLETLKASEVLTTEALDLWVSSLSRMTLAGGTIFYRDARGTQTTLAS